MEDFLYKDLDKTREIYKDNNIPLDIPDIIFNNLNEKIKLRSYQEDALKNFLIYYKNYENGKFNKIHSLFHMATGSGKTVIMASLMLFLYQKGYRKFLFFVNANSILSKTIDNFTNNLSGKYLFSSDLSYLGNKFKIKKVDTFSSDEDNIEIVFTSVQKLHQDLTFPRENTLTYDDFTRFKVVLISDESHHINASTKASVKEKEDNKSWEYSVKNAYDQNKQNILLEFTATCDLNNAFVKEKYLDKIVFNYTLSNFRESGFTKEFNSFQTDTDFFTRTLIALVLSEYRRFLFSDLKINAKPVVLLKSQKIEDSNNFYIEFFKKLDLLTIADLEALTNFLSDSTSVLKYALSYFKEKDGNYNLLLTSLKQSFTKETSLVVNSEKSKEDYCLAINSLEDENNPYRLIFAVSALDEGWDVLNLFDIVRLYDTRQGGKSAPAKYTIREAQLIGRGARYFPFKYLDADPYKRKFDNDINNKNRILESMFFHFLNDSKYITELRQALKQTGLIAEEETLLTYHLKDEFRESSFYKQALVYSNSRVLVSRTSISELDSKLRNKQFSYTVNHKASEGSLFLDRNSIDSSNTRTVKTLRDIPLNISLGGIDYFKELHFNFLQTKFPSLKSLEEFITSDSYLGKVSVEFIHSTDLKTSNIFDALKSLVFPFFSDHVLKIKDTYRGTVDFKPVRLANVLTDKTIKVSHIQKDGGFGASQNNNPSSDLKLDLSNTEWYVFTDNYGTSEEKKFLKYFKDNIEPMLVKRGLVFYVVRNERIPELALYSFDKGERFEPDFIIFIINPNKKTLQTYVEPKGAHLLEEDSWKEGFLKELEDTSKTDSEFYEIYGLPFFNSTTDSLEHFAYQFRELIEKL